MPRKERLFIPGALYHVYCRTARGERVLSKEAEAAAFLETLVAVRDLHGLTFLAWCLMSNHYHLVLRTPEVPLWRSMARIQGRFARDFNRRHRYLGRLWQSRYKARVVDSERYFRRLVAYVHLNPVSAGVVSDPASWKWSGHRALLGRARSRLLDPHRVLRSYGETMREARAAYAQSLRAVAEARWLACGLRELPWWTDCDDLEETASPDQREMTLGYDGGRRVVELPRLDLEEVSAAYAQVRSASLAELVGRGHRADLVDHRVTLTTIAVGSFGHRVAAVAAHLRKNPGTVSRWLGIAERRLSEDDAYRDELLRLTEQIAAAGSKRR